LIEGEIRSETIEKFYKKYGLKYIPRTIFAAFIDLKDAINLHPIFNKILGDYIKELEENLVHLDGKNRDDIIRIIHGYPPVSQHFNFYEEKKEDKEKKRKFSIF